MSVQGKTIIQAEIDATCELADFYRFDVQFALVRSLSHLATLNRNIVSSCLLTQPVVKASNLIIT